MSDSDEISKRKLLEGIMDDTYIGKATRTGQPALDDKRESLEARRKRMNFSPDAKTKKSRGGDL